MKMVKPGMDGKQMRSMYKDNPSTKHKAKKHFTQEEDDADDKKNGIKEGSKRDNAIDKARGLKMKRKSKIMIKPSRKGLLHEKLGVAKGQKIPTGKLNQALNSNSPSERKEANFAKNFGK